MKRLNLKSKLKRIGISNKKTVKVIASILIIAISLQSNVQLLGSIAFAQDASGSASTDLENLRVESLDTLLIDTEVIQNSSAKVRLKSIVRTLSKKNYKASEKVEVEIVNSPSNEMVSIDVKDASGENAHVEVVEEIVNEEKTIEINPSQQFRPGKYTVQIRDESGTVLSTQDFLWGVLALNTNKSVYYPNEKANIAIAVLDEMGAMVCDAFVSLTITNPDTRTTELTTKDEEIKVNNQCTKKEFSLTPDYETEYDLKGEGEYSLKLFAQTKNGSYGIEEKVKVQKTIPFEIERISTTRIYPPLTYPMSLKLKADSDFSGTITDVVPDSFEIGELESTVGFDSVRTVTKAEISGSQVLGAVSLKLPLEESENVTSVFGDVLKDPFLKEKYNQYGVEGHDGVDFGVPIGTEVYSTDRGVVVLADEDGDYGSTVVIQHDWGRSYYGHLSEFEVEAGDDVSQGELIALSGNTGLSTGPHLHFGVKPNQVSNNGYYGKVDPAPYLGLPDESSVLGASAVADIKVKVITWRVDLKKGEEVTLGYSYKTPPQSPQFYMMGPLRFFDKEQKELYSENRQWQLAVDAYAGSQVKTIEYILGGGTDLSTRATTNMVYAGSSFNTTKGSAGTATIVIPGTNVSVRSAYVESRFVIQTAVDVTDIDMVFDATPGPNSGNDTRISPVIQNGGSRWDTSGPTGWMMARADVTSQFSIQDDSEWATGVAVVAGTGVTGPSFASLTSKLVITYESDYSTSSHTEIKTVRFPLDSTVSGDTGTTRAACAGSSTCSFAYNANIPDLLSGSNANIESVFFELHAMSDSATAPSFTPQINGGTAGSAVSDQEIIADVRDMYVLYAPIVGGSDFLPNTAQTLDIVNGTLALNALGGELIVTYQYSTGASSQTETVRYWAEQDTAENGVTKTSFPDGASNITISNTGLSVTNIWYKVRTAPSAAQTFTVFGNVGSAGEKSNAYTLTGTNARAGEAVIIYDMSADASSFSSSTTKVAGATQFSSATGDSEVSAELFVTFTWTGSSGGAQTKTVLFNGGTSPISSAVATEYHNFNPRIFVPETVTKTHRSSYIDATHSHSDATAIQNTANTIYLNGGSIMAVTPQDDLEAFSRTYAASISAEMFTYDYSASYKTIGFTRRAFGISHTIGVAEELAVSDVFVLTYDADFSQDGTAENSKSLRTIEYVLGGGSDTTSRTTGTNVYAGSSWNTTKGSAGTVSIEIPGTGIAVRNAYLEARISVSTAANTTDIDMLFDATPGPNSGTDGRVSPVIQGTFAETSGQGYWMLVRAEVGSQLAVQTDSDWNSGVDVVAGLSTTGPTTQLNSIKLVVTYEQDYDETPHDEIKTVRFPLDSTATGDTGSTRAACAASATCSFSYNANIPDLLSSSNANIESAFFELHAVSDSATAPSFTPQINGGTAGSSHSDGEALADVRDMYVLYAPIIGGSDFLPNTAQTLDIVNGSVDLNTLGGELIVTYKFNTGSSSQTETVRYFVEQDTAQNSTTKTSFTRSSFNISNSGFSVSNLWFKVRTSHAAAQTFTVFGNVGGAGEQSNAYTLTGTNPRGGEAVIIYDMSADASSFNASPTTVAGASQFSSATGDSEVNAELFITFTWTGTNFGTQTKTVLYNGGTSGAAPTVATEYHNFPAFIFLPESVTKTHRSTYVEVMNNVGDTTSISSGTRTLALNGQNGTVMATQDDVEAFSMTLLQEITSTDFSEGATIAFQRRAFALTDTYNAADRYFFSNQFVITYDAEFAAAGGGGPTLDQLMRHGAWFNSSGVSQPFTF